MLMVISPTAGKDRDERDKQKEGQMKNVGKTDIWETGQWDRNTSESQKSQGGGGWRQGSQAPPP